MASLSVSQIVRVVPLLPPQHSVLLCGDHGIGKTAIIRQINDLLSEMNGGVPRKLHYMNVSLMVDGTDIQGLPFLKELEDYSVTQYALPEWFSEAMHTPCTIFFDEINRTVPEIMNGLMQIILEHRIGRHKLHPETRVYAAANTSSQYKVIQMDPAVLSRFWIATLAPTAQEWVEWARKSGVNSDMIQFLSENPQWLDPPQKEGLTSGKGAVTHSTNEIHPCRRSWAETDEALRHMGLYESLDLDTIFVVCSPRIGVDAAAAFTEALRKMEKIKASDILERYAADEKLREKFKKIDILDVLTSTIDAVIYAFYALSESGRLQYDNLNAFLTDVTNPELFLSAFRRLVTHEKADYHFLDALTEVHGERANQLVAASLIAEDAAKKDEA